MAEGPTKGISAKAKIRGKLNKGDNKQEMKTIQPKLILMPKGQERHKGKGD